MLDSDCKSGKKTWKITIDDIEVAVSGFARIPALDHEILQRVPASFIMDMNYQGCGLSRKGIGQVDVDGQCFRVPNKASAAELRRFVTAVVVAPALRRKKMLVHGVVVSAQDSAILILGDYGAGKTTVSLLLRDRGFRVLAGDSALVQADGEIRGGSRAILVREGGLWAAMGARQPTRLWLSDGIRRWEAGECPGGPYYGVQLKAIIKVDVHTPSFVERRLSSMETSYFLESAGYRIFNRCVFGAPIVAQDLNLVSISKRISKISKDTGRVAMGVEIKGCAVGVADSIESMFSSLR